MVFFDAVKHLNIPIMPINDFFQTTHTNLCASLLSVGYELDSVDKSNPSKTVFFIRRDERIDEVINAYFSRHLRVDAMSLLDNLKALKSRIYHT